MKEKIVVIGGGGHAKVLISILKKIDKYNIVGYSDIIDKGLILNVPYVGTDDILKNLYKLKKVRLAAVGIGQIKNIELRKAVIEKISTIGFQFPAIISPKSIINEDVMISEGAVVMDGALLQPGVTIGRYSIINTGSKIDHDCKIGDYVHIAPGVTVCGNVKIGHYSFIGAGSTIVNNVVIKDNQFIKANSLCK